MPVYDFVCRGCNKKFEITCHVDDYRGNKVECPKCGGKKVERVWSSVYVETSKKS